MHKLIKSLLVSGVVSLWGCASQSPLVQVTSQLLNGTLGGSAAAIDGATLNPAFSYLRVRVNQQTPAILARGYVESPALGEKNVWYSAKQEVLKTSMGRVVATAGLPLNRVWVAGVGNIPQWAEVGIAGVFYDRTLDDPSRHIYNLAQRVKVEQVPSAPIEAAWAVDAAFKPPAGQTVVWFKETAQNFSAGPVSGVVASSQSDWYAVNMAAQPPAVLYSYQCIAPEWCFHIQPWPREPQ